MHKRYLLLFGILLTATLISGGILASSISSADTEKQSDATVTVGSACTMFRESTVPHVVSVGPSSYREDVGTTRLKTVCNDTNGYAIYAIGYSNDTDGDTNMYGEESNLTIPTGTEAGDVSNWSMKLSKDLNAYNPENLTITPAFTNYTSVPSTQTKVASFEGATDTTDGSIVETTYSIRVSSDQLADTYTGQVKYTMVHPADGAAPEGPEIPKLYIQDVDAASCPKQRTLVYDKRDEEPYYIQEITANGTTLCWMTSNLNLAGGTVLTSTLSNVKPGESYTLPESSINGFYTYDVANVYNSGSTDCSSSQGCKSYYNYTAATLEAHVPAESDSMYDICPAGWRLPRSAEYEDLLADYVSEVGEAGSAPWYTEKSGMLSGGSPSVIAAGSLGFYWSSTTNRSSGGYPNGLFASSTPSMGSQSSFAGGAIRCVAKPILTYMQDINTSEYCSTTPQVVYDKRDDEPYVIQVMEDGNCWMLNNLRLDLGQVSADSLKGNTNASDNSIEYLKGIKTGTSSDRYAMSSVEELADGASYSNPRFTKSDISEQYSWGTESYGAYYNFCAASAGSYCYGDGDSYGSPEGEVSEDICPKGWRLPTGGLNGEFYELYTKYPDSTSFYTAFKASFPGSSQLGYIFSTGSTLNLWSSTPVNGQFEYFLYAHSIAGTISAQESSERTKGFSIRCIAKAPEPEVAYIQDITPDNCPTEPTIVYDKRDNAAYTIQKLVDDNCWMLDNLRLNPAEVSGQMLKGQTNASDETIDYLLGNRVGTSDDKYATAGVIDQAVTEGSYSAPIVISEKTDLEYTNGSFTNKVGVLYNYCAASAGSYCYGNGDEPGTPSGITTEDICPKGWRLPTGSYTSGDFTVLYSWFNNDNANYINALHATLGGLYYTYDNQGYYADGGEIGYFWGSTQGYPQYSAGYIESLRASESNVYPATSMDRINHQSIRCIAKDSEQTAKIYIQDVTDETCPAKKTLVYDKRDEKTYYIQKIATNGTSQCWMTTNLDIDGGTVLEPTLSNLAPGTTYTLPTSSLDGFDVDFPAENVYNTDRTECVDNDNPCYSYYSHQAATAGFNAGAGDVQYDICPAGWRLPSLSSLNDLISRFGYVGDITAAPWSGVFSGQILEGTFYNVGNLGRFWTSEIRADVANAYVLQYQTGSSTMISSLARARGAAVRCIAKKAEAPTPGPDIPHDIQDITLDNCPTTPATVYDSRDGNAYKIAKLDDGNCWMLDNLNLGRNTIKVLTPNDTNIIGDFTLPGSISLGMSSYELPQINIDSRNDTLSYGDGENKIGVYYNYCAATAGTYCDAEGEASGDAYQDICPKGWRLPTGGDAGEYQTLISTYNDAASLKNALHASLSGYFKYSSTGHIGTTGSAWTSTGTGDDHIYSLDVRAKKVQQDYSSNRNAGISIRCIAKNGTEPVVKPKMQQMTLSSCPGEITTVVDSRDGEEYNVGLLADGNCWMLDNLRLDPAVLTTTLSSKNTNMPANYAFDLPDNNTDILVDTYVKPHVIANNKDTVYGAYGNAGVYYDYCAASAGTYCYSATGGSDAHYDICPKGWRLPTEDEITAAKTAYYGSTTPRFYNAYRGALAGKVSPSGAEYRGMSDFIWSSSMYDGYMMAILYSDNLDPSETTRETRAQALSVRCVMKRPSDSQSQLASMYIQDITKSNCPTEISMVYDKRDNTPYAIQKLEDGNCWLLENLRLGLTDLVETLSTDNTNMSPTVSFTLPSSGSVWEYNEPQLRANYAKEVKSYGSGNVLNGIYYNYCAASAGTYCYNDGEGPDGFSQYDICPKGWRMPTGGEDGEYGMLFGLHNSDIGTYRTSLRIAETGSTTDYLSPTTGIYYSSTNQGGRNMALYFRKVNSDLSLYYTYGFDRKNGYSVRCVAK